MTLMYPSFFNLHSHLYDNYLLHMRNRFKAKSCSMLDVHIFAGPLVDIKYEVHLAVCISWSEVSEYCNKLSIFHTAFLSFADAK